MALEQTGNEPRPHATQVFIGNARHSLRNQQACQGTGAKQTSGNQRDNNSSTGHPHVDF